MTYPLPWRVPEDEVDDTELGRLFGWEWELDRPAPKTDDLSEADEEGRESAAYILVGRAVHR